MAKAFKKILSCPVCVLALALSASIIALAGALTAQFVLELEPCILCVYQRIPFVIVILLSLVGLVFKSTRKPMIVLCGLAFFANSGLAFYHHGVEQQWWISAFEACAVPESFLKPNAAESTEGFLAALLKTPSVPCAKIPWIDPLFGQSMAFWNIPYCIGAGLICVAHLLIKRSNYNGPADKQ